MGGGYRILQQRELTVQDIILIQKQLEVAQQLNHLLSEAIAEIGEAVSEIDSTSVKDQKAATALDKVKRAVSKLEKEVEEFNKRLK
jgi:predicted  nucleic acid-binding Zn-ribbon protein